MNEAWVASIVAVAGVLVQAGFLLATVKFLAQRQEEQHRDVKRDLNGLGSKGRANVAETIILAKDQPDFAVTVRKLVNGI